MELEAVNSNFEEKNKNVAVIVGVGGGELKNIYAISISFMLLFLAHSSMATLQSTINSDNGLGVYSLSTVYASIVIAAMFIPSFVIKRLTVKWTMALSMCGYLINMIVQFWPSFGTLIPAGVVVGISASLLWAAKSTYLTHVGYEYAKLTGQNSERVIVRFFGIFFMFFQSNKIWGNLISSLVLKDSSRNTTINLPPEVLDRCGFNFCPGDPVLEENSNLERPSEAKIGLLTAIFIGSLIAAIAVVTFLVDPMSRYGEKERLDKDGHEKSGRELLKSTFVHMKKPFQILIIPLTIWSGLEQGFIEADYTQAYIGCAWGVENIGFVFICFGITDALGSFSLGQVIRFVGRVPVFVFGALLNIGFILAYVNTELLCIDLKLYILLATIVVGMGAYLTLELLIKRKKS